MLPRRLALDKEDMVGNDEAMEEGGSDEETGSGEEEERSESDDGKGKGPSRFIEDEVEGVDDDEEDSEDGDVEETAEPGGRPRLLSAQWAASERFLKYDRSFHLSIQQRMAYNLVDRAESVFITGPAGSGKSVCLANILVALHKKPDVLVTAPTGRAALLLPHGRTVHAAFGYRKNRTTGQFQMTPTPEIEERVRTLHTLVIDEVGMLPVSIFRELNLMFRSIRHTVLPFGGVQLVLCGDFLQLQPIHDFNTPSSSLYLFRCDEWKALEDYGMRTIVMDTCYRHMEDGAYKAALDDVRLNRQLSPATVAILNSRVGVEPPSKSTYVVTRRTRAEELNTAEMEKLPGAVMHYSGTMVAEARIDEKVLKGMPTFQTTMQHFWDELPVPKNLTLKVGCSVLLVQDNRRHGLCCGAHGIVVDVGRQGPVVKFDVLPTPLLVKQSGWTMDVSTDYRLHAFQYPLVLGYALLLHWSNGMTLDAMTLDLTSCTAEGQAYAALSRVRRASDLYLVGTVPQPTVSGPAREYYVNLQSMQT